ncbi:hypothetical protein VPH35_139049 [Triticum aestivum]
MRRGHDHGLICTFNEGLKERLHACLQFLVRGRYLVIRDLRCSRDTRLGGPFDLDWWYRIERVSCVAMYAESTLAYSVIQRRSAYPSSLFASSLIQFAPPPPRACLLPPPPPLPRACPHPLLLAQIQRNSRACRFLGSDPVSFIGAEMDLPPPSLEPNASREPETLGKDDQD